MAFRIMVVESDPSFADEVRTALETAVFIDPSADPYRDARLQLDVEVLTDGELALQIAKSNPPDLIVLCVELPKMSGYSICNKIKKKPEIKGIPLIIMSSEATPEIFEQHKRLKTRAEDYLIKPFPMAELVAKVGFLLGLSQEGEFSDYTSPDGVQELGFDLGANLVQDDTSTAVEYSYDEVKADALAVEEEGEPIRIDPLTDEDEVGRTVIDNDINLATDLAFAALEMQEASQDGVPAAAQEVLIAPATTEESDIAIETNSAQGELEDEVVIEDQDDEPLGVAPEMTLLEDEPAPEEQLDAESYADPSLLEPEQEVGELDEAQAQALTPEAAPTTEVGAEEASEPLPLPLPTPPLPPAAQETFSAAAAPANPALEELQQRVSELERENRHLSDELQNARVRPSESGSSFSRDRELLNLREIINRKEKEILDLKDDLDAKERQILDHKDKVRELERKVRDMDEKLLGIEREIVSIQERSEALQADKSKLQEREAQVKARLEEAKKEIDKAYREIDALKERQAQERQEREAERQAQAQAAERARQELEQRLTGELEAARQAHTEEVARLAQEHQAALQEQEAKGQAELERLAQEQQEALAEAERRRAQELEQLRSGQEQALALLREEQRAELERLQQQHAEQLQQRSEELSQEKERALEALRTEGREQLERLKAEQAEKIRELTERKRQELEQREAEQAGELERLRAEHQDGLERQRQEHAGALAGLAREHEQRLEEQAQEQQAQVEELEGRLAEGGQRLYELGQQLEESEKKLRDVQHQRNALEDELHTTRDLVSQRDQQLTEYTQQVADYQAQVVRAYNKIRADEQLAEKAKRAMAIAVTLLEEQRRLASDDEGQSEL